MSPGQQFSLLLALVGVVFLIVGGVLKAKETSKTVEKSKAKMFLILGAVFVAGGGVGALGLKTVKPEGGAYYYF